MYNKHGGKFVRVERLDEIQPEKIVQIQPEKLGDRLSANFTAGNEGKHAGGIDRYERGIICGNCEVYTHMEPTNTAFLHAPGSGHDTGVFKEWILSMKSHHYRVALKKDNDNIVIITTPYSYTEITFNEFNIIEFSVQIKLMIK